MPFESVKQEKWAFSTKQPFAKKWAGMTNQKNLPDSAPKNKKKKNKNSQAMKDIFKK